MGLEMMGFTRANIDELWIDQSEYKDKLSSAVKILEKSGMNISIYNHQLCLINDDILPYYRKSISDWKNEYDPTCEPCQVRDQCGGFFNSAKYGASSQIQALKYDGSPLYNHKESPANETETRWKRKPIPHTSIS